MIIWILWFVQKIGDRNTQPLKLEPDVPKLIRRRRRLQRLRAASPLGLFVHGTIFPGGPPDHFIGWGGLHHLTDLKT